MFYFQKENIYAHEICLQLEETMQCSTVAMSVEKACE